MQAGARLGQVNMQNASKQKKILAEESKLMKDEDPSHWNIEERERKREETEELKLEKKMVVNTKSYFLTSAVEQGWLLDVKIGQ